MHQWCFIYAIFHQPIVIYVYKVIQLIFSLNGLLAELPAILDNFFTSTTSDYMYRDGWSGWWGATKWQVKIYAV